MTRKHSWRIGLTAALLTASLAACGDDAVTPLAPAGPAALVETSLGTASFTVPKDGGTFTLPGGHVIVFKRDAICDPLTSGYGPDTWTLPCQTLRGPIVITATTWTDELGNPRVDFLPNLRFAAGRGGESKVQLQLRTPNASQPTATVYYCPTVGECYDEAVSDAAVRTKRDPAAGWVYRYIRHFSGYNVTAGRATTEVSEVSTMSDSY